METQKPTEKEKKAGLKKRSVAKAGGLKSTFALGEGKVLMTSFGKGNDAVPEKLIVDGVITDYAENIEVELLKKDFRVKGRLFESPVVAADPYRKEKVGKDILDRKDVLEEDYFGRTFEDNIHIQLIYNVMDIEKILSIHINNILYGLNNVLNREQDTADDVIGMMHAKSYENFKNGNKYSQFLEYLKNPQLSYYGAAFYRIGFDTKARKGKVEKRDEMDIYYIISLLSTVRQFLAHKSDYNRNDKHENKHQVALYTFDQEFDDLYTSDNKKFRDAARKVLDSLYDIRIDSLNESFLDNAEKDLTILFKAYGIENRDEKAAIIRTYYDFLVRKEYKNLGFSLKKLRECIIAGNQYIAHKKYDTMRSRLNRLFDFAAYRYYEENPDRVSALVEKLRAHSDQEEKERIYRDESWALWKGIKTIVNDYILREMNGKNLAMMRADRAIRETSLDRLTTPSWKPISADASYFTKIIYLLTLFLDGKEINDLVTTLINKFENIASFNAVLASVGQESPIKREYSIFENSKEVSGELRVLNSFARMETPDASTNRAMFVEAARILGYDADRESLEQYFDTLLDKDASKADKGFRNFIRNNVINSVRFKYLIRYCNVDDVRSFAKNKHLVEFVMKSIPEAQILRYYKSCVNDYATEYTEKMRGELADIIRGMSFEKLNGVVQQARRGTDEEKEKLQKQNIIRLYLAVCYLFFKNLVYVNSRYFLAFYCLERDMKLWGFKKPDALENSYTAITELFMEQGKVRKTAKTKMVTDENGNVTYEEVSEKHIPAVYLKANLENSDNVVINTFRNSAEHMNAIRFCGGYLHDISSVESYFEIYHYITQCYLRDRLAGDDDVKNPKIAEYFANVEKYHTYSKDFVKALCIPFGYNLARFKNLTIDGLFDMNDTRENKQTDFED